MGAAHGRASVARSQRLGRRPWVVRERAAFRIRCRAGRDQFQRGDGRADRGDGMSGQFASLDDVMGSNPVMPVIVIARLEHAVPLARALVAGGVRVLEVTLRSACALAAIRAISEAVPDAIVGAGTILNERDLQAAGEAGARFGVSPGATPGLLRAARDGGWSFLPGVISPSEAMVALDEGFHALKFFPAVPAGGIEMLKAIGGPLPQQIGRATCRERGCLSVYLS